MSLLNTHMFYKGRGIKSRKHTSRLKNGATDKKALEIEKHTI